MKRNNAEVLEYQNRFVEKLASITLNYDHVLYNINNESWAGAEWENHWARLLHKSAEKHGVKIFVTSMHMRPSVAVRNVMSRRDLYSFVEISQNNQDYMGARGHAHYENLMEWRAKINSTALGPMPMNNEKVYGARAGENRSAGSGQEAVARFWRNIFGGCAASRFHRPAAPAHWGLGLGEAAQVNLKAMTMLLEELDIFACAPGNHLLTPVIRSTEAYCLANIGKQYAVYFPEGRYLVDLDPWVFVTELKVRWLDIERGVWLAGQTVPVNWETPAPDAYYRENEIRDNLRGRITLATPNNRPHVALLEVID